MSGVKNINHEGRDLNRTLSSLVSMSENGSTNSEKENAKEKIKSICLKYGIECNEISDLDSKVRSFKYNSLESKEILSQCIFDVMGSGIEVTCDSTDKLLFSNVNASQFVKVKELYNYYWREYKKERYNFLQKFILENQIGVKGFEKIAMGG